MKKSYYIGIAFLVALGIAVSFFLTPGARELGLMHMQDKKFEEALGIYEKRYQSGDHSIAVTIPLSKLYLQYGQVTKAITIMERFIEENPDNIDAMEHLTTLYQHGNRPDDYLLALEKLNRLHHSSETLKKLAAIYNFKGLYDKQVETLDALVKDQKATPQDIMMLVYLHINRKHYDQALQIIDGLSLKTVTSLPIDVAEFLCGALIEAGKREDALTLAKTYLNADTTGKNLYDHIIFFANSFENKGFVEGALALLTPVKPAMDTHPALLSAYASAELTNGNTDDSFQMLLNIFETKKLAPETTRSFIALILARGDYQYLPGIIAATDLKSLPESQLTQLVEVSLSQSKYGLAPVIAENLGKDYLDIYPFYAIALSLHNAIRIGQTPDLPLHTIRTFPVDKQISMATIYLNAGFKDEAFSIIQGFQPSQIDTSIDPLDLAMLYINQSKPALGKQVFSHVTIETGSTFGLQTKQALILFDTALGSEKPALDWLQSQTAFDKRFIDLLNYTATIYKQPEVALRTAEQLYSKHPSLENQVNLGEALILHQRFTEALSHLRPIASKYNNAVYPYVEALLSDPSNQQELTAFLGTPHFTELESKQKHNIAFLLLEHHKKTLAEPIFFAFAQHASASSSDVSQLLYLWGPEPPEYGKKWLISRATSAKGKEQQGWLKRLNEIGLNDTVITLAEAGNTHPGDAYIESLLTKKEFSKVENLLRPEMAKAQNQKRTESLVNYAMQANLFDLAEQGYKRLYNRQPKDYALLKALANVTYSQGKYSNAETYIKDYIAHDANDYQMQYYYAEILRKKKSYSEAEKHYTKTTELIVASSKKDIKMELTHALCLYYLGDSEKSFGQFRELLAKYPQHAEIRESFANLLIERGLYSEAEEVLYGKGHT